MFKKGLCIIVFVLFFAPVFEAQAIDFMGPPTAGLKQGQWNIGYLYSFSETDIEVSGLGGSVPLEDVEINRHYVNFGYGLADCWEGNVRLGVADVEYLDTDFAWGFNTKVTFASDETFDWGALFQMSWIDTEGSENLSELGLGTVTYDFDAYEMQIAVGPTLKMDGCKIYGGPFVHLIEGDLDATVDGVTLGFDVEEDSAFGGYVGALIDLAENLVLTVEGQFTGGGWGAGGGIVWKF